jgi:hypothetical protein
MIVAGKVSDDVTPAGEGMRKLRERECLVLLRCVVM